MRRMLRTDDTIDGTASTFSGIRDELREIHNSPRLAHTTRLAAEYRILRE